MIQKYLILIDEQSQEDTLNKISNALRNDGIGLVYQQINPTDFQLRNEIGELSFDLGQFKNSISSIEYFKSADLILCDYNLISNVINGYEVIQIVRDLKYHSKKKIILYSAEIKDVISSILNSERDFEELKISIVKMMQHNIEFIKRTGYDQEVIKFIKKEPEFDFELELTKWFHKRGNDTFNYLFPAYQGRKFDDVAQQLKDETDESIQFKRELIEQIIAYLSKINGLENA